jgi:dethiobiotin synthetase
MAIDCGEVTEFCRAQIRAYAGGPLLIEVAGGVMAPLFESDTCLDLIAALGAPVIFVAGSYLGAVSHALTGLEVLIARGAHVALVVVSESEDSAGLVATHDMLRAHAPGVRVRVAPRDDTSWAGEAADLLRRSAAM